MTNKCMCWLARDLTSQPLDKMKKLCDQEALASECWIYQENNQFYVTDFDVRLKLTINPKKLSKIKAQIQTAKSKSESYQLLKINAKQYLYSSMIDFKSRNKEPFVFMFLEDFDFKSEVKSGVKKVDLNKLSYGSHPSINKSGEKCPTSTNIITRSASKTRANDSTQIYPTPSHNEKLQAKSIVKPAEKKAEGKKSNLSLLINQMSQESSLLDYTIKIVEKKTPQKLTNQNESNKQQSSNKKATTNLNEAFVKNVESQSTQGSSLSSSSQDLFLLDVDSQQYCKKENNKTSAPKRAIQLSSQCPPNFSQFQEVNCSKIDIVATLESQSPPPPPLPLPTLPSQPSPPLPVSSITITKQIKRQDENLIDSDRDMSLNEAWPEENKAAADIISNAETANLRVQDTQGLGINNPLSVSSQILARRDTVTSCISDTIANVSIIIDWPPPTTVSGENANNHMITSSTLNHSMSMPSTWSAKKRRRRKLMSQQDKAYFNDDSSDDDVDADINTTLDDDDVDESASMIGASNNPHCSRSKTKWKREVGSIVTSSRATTNLSINLVNGCESGGSRSPSSTHGLNKNKMASRNRSSSSSSSSLSSVSFNSSSSLSSSSLTSPPLSCVTSATIQSSKSSALLFAPRHLFEYKRRLLARKCDSEKKPNKFCLVSSIFSPRLANVNQHRKRTKTVASTTGGVVAALTAKTPNEQSSTRLNSCLLDKVVSLDRQRKIRHGHSFDEDGKSPTSQTPSRRRLFDPKNQDIDNVLGGCHKNKSTTRAANAALNIPNSDTTTVTATTSNNLTNLTTTSDDKSIPAGQNPNRADSNDMTTKMTTSAIYNFNNSNNSNDTSNKSTSPEFQINMYNHNFSLDLNSFQDFLVDKKSLVQLDK